MAQAIRPAPARGSGIWLWGIIAALVVAALALIGGAEYNVLDVRSLPRLPVDSGP